MIKGKGEAYLTARSLSTNTKLSSLWSTENAASRVDGSLSIGRACGPFLSASGVIYIMSWTGKLACCPAWAALRLLGPIRQSRFGQMEGSSSA